MSVRSAYEEIKDEGRLEGRLEGERNLLLRMLEHRFGDVPPEAAARIAAADTTTLERWAEQLLTATRLEDALRLETR